MFSSMVANEILAYSFKNSLDFNMDMTKLWWKTWSQAFDPESWDFRRALTPTSLQRENQQFKGTGGISERNSEAGFLPAFQDSATECVYPSCFANGALSPIHTLDGLPNEVVLERDSCGHVVAVKPTVIAGFIRDGRFFTREQAARSLAVQGGC